MSFVKNYFGFRASLWYLTPGKNFMVIRPAVPVILGKVVNVDTQSFRGVLKALPEFYQILFDVLNNFIFIISITACQG